MAHSLVSVDPLRDSCVAVISFADFIRVFFLLLSVCFYLSLRFFFLSFYFFLSRSGTKDREKEKVDPIGTGRRLVYGRGLCRPRPDSAEKKDREKEETLDWSPIMLNRWELLLFHFDSISITLQLTLLLSQLTLYT